MTRYARDEVRVVDHVSAVSRTLNNAQTRVAQLKAAVVDLKAAVHGGSAHAAQAALKRALEGIHELDDGLRDGEWSQAAWAPRDVDLWSAHIAGRNAAHHKSWSLVALHTDGPIETRLRWDLRPDDVQELTSRRGKVEYGHLLAKQPVLPPLEQVLERISATV